MIRKNLCSATALAFFLAGCTEFHEAEKQEKAFLGKSDTMNVPARDLITVSDKPYLVGEPVKVAEDVPPVLLEAADLSISNPISLREAALRASLKTHIPVRVRPDAETGDGTDETSLLGPAPTFNGTSLPAPPSVHGSGARRSTTNQGWNGRGEWLNYSGTRYGLFSALAARFGVSQRYVNGTVEFFRNQTKTYIIPAFNESSTNTASIMAVSGGGGSSSGGNGMSGGGGGYGMSGGSSMGSGTGSGSSGGQTQQGMTGVYKQIKSDPWAHLQETASLAANGASVLADPGLGTITVSGTPEQIAGVDEWYDGLKTMLMKQVAITVRVYSLKFDRESNYGFSPEIAAKNFGKYFAASATPAATPLIQSQAVPFSFGASIIKGKLNGTNVAVQALQSLDNATELDERAVVTTNGVSAPFANQTNTAYVQQAASYLATNAGSSSSLTPGQVMAGFEGSVTPRVLDNKIDLDLHLTIQTLLSINNASGSSGMQLPKTASTIITDNVVMGDGDLLVLSGYTGDSTSRKQNGVGAFWNPIFGGGGDAENTKDRILITVEAHTL